MKILMLNNEYPPLGGGTGTVNEELLNRFIKYPDLKIDLITSDRGMMKSIEMLSDSVRIIKYPVNNKNIHHSSNVELIKYTVRGCFAAFKYHKREKYDLSFSWSTVPAGYISHVLHRIKRLPFVVRVGGPDIPGFEDRYKRMYRLISPIIKRIWKRSEVMIAKCRIESDMIREINNDLHVLIFPNGIDVQKFKPLNNKKQNEPMTIICPARLIKRKGQDILIKAVAELKKKGVLFQVNLIGEGDEKEAYRKLANELNVSELIEFKGYVPREKMLDEYRQADLFCLPSYNEGMSNSLLEAMACALPVIVTDVGGTEELTDESNGFVFQPGDVDGLVNILRDVHGKKDTLIEMGRNSRQKAEQFSWDAIAEQYHQLFKSILKKVR